MALLGENKFKSAENCVEEDDAYVDLTSITKKATSYRIHQLWDFFPFLVIYRWWWWRWWWWIVFVVWLTDERPLVLFPAGSLSEILTIVNLRHAASKVWTSAEPEFWLSWMKLCSSDNHYTTAPQGKLLQVKLLHWCFSCF